MHRTFAALLIASALTTLPAVATAQGSPSNSSLAPTPERETSETWRPIDPFDEYRKGVMALQQKRYRTAIHALGRLTDAKPGAQVAWRLLGVAYAGQSRWTASRRAYDRALRLDPNDITSHAGRGAALQALNDPRAQQEAQWLKARTEACADTCPEAGVLRTLQSRRPFANDG